jgi:hypothetical protein
LKDLFGYTDRKSRARTVIDSRQSGISVILGADSLFVLLFVVKQHLQQIYQLEQTKKGDYLVACATIENISQRMFKRAARNAA